MIEYGKVEGKRERKCRERYRVREDDRAEKEKEVQRE
jgi:hypothetical protein